LEELPGEGGEQAPAAQAKGEETASKAEPKEPQEKTPADLDQEKGEENAPADLEELESVEDGQPESSAPSETEQTDEWQRLASSSLLKSWTLDELKSLVEAGRSAIVMEDGVFRIKKELYTSPEKAREASPTSRNLREIADEAVHGKRNAEGAPPGTSGGAGEDSGGIRDLIRDEDAFDLSKVLSPEREGAAEAPIAMEPEQTIPLRLKRTGIDFDEFLSAYPRSLSHTTLMKSLVEVSRRVSAVAAVLFLKRTGGYLPDITIGVTEGTAKDLRFTVDEPFARLFLDPRLALTINQSVAETRSLRPRVDPEDHRYMKRILLLPASYRGQEAYLLLSLAIEGSIGMEALLKNLLVQ
jgi:hypothetical protein